MKQLSIVIVNYNVKYFLEQALMAVRNASKGLDIEIFVVDNNSVDDSVPMVKRKFPEVILIENTQNVGFSKANNQAIRQSAGKYILLLNPDTVIKEDTLTKCIEFMDMHPDAGALGVKMIDGSGKYLPESKRGFPTPFVAFCKTFGLSALFPKSRQFNRYHLGYLDENQNHEVDVLAGAFMFIRNAALEKAGLLDEAFFMYGEDIDLSYRITLAGFKNYYLAETTIIHYKGESTKKGSLNYVKVFYQAMIIFAKKHFSGNQAWLFVLMLQFAIFFRAFLTVCQQLFFKWHLPILDGLTLFGGTILLKHFWAVYHFQDENYYSESFFYFNAPLYTVLWLWTIFLSGGYDEKYDLRKLIRGIFLGFLVIAAIYGFLNMEYRSSRAVLVLSFFWAILLLPLVRYCYHFFQFGNFKLGRTQPKRLVIAGSVSEGRRVKNLLQEAEVRKDIIGLVAPSTNFEQEEFLSSIDHLDEVVHIYKIEEIIFCSKDIRVEEIMQWMVKLGPKIEYKILPQESVSIIGSHSKNSTGELYTIDIHFKIDLPYQRRNKRVFDLALSFFLILTLPYHLFFLKNRTNLIRNIFKVFSGQKTWVGYFPQPHFPLNLPVLKPGVLSPVDELRLSNVSPKTIERLNLLYAKNYNVSKDIDIIWNGYSNLDRKNAT